MIIARTIPELKATTKPLRQDGRNIGFVPTMGALHDGHLSLIRHARAHADCVIASIFVNPTQFAPHEDFDSYPRTEEQDAQKLRSENVDILFLPTQSELYPNGKDTEIKAGSEAQGLETDFRPHFFDGVVNVVSRLFEATNPDIAVFGEKDFQQLQVIKQMVQDQGMPITIIGAPIARDNEGLALSSRNAYLSKEEIDIARQLNKIIQLDIAVDDMKERVFKAGFNKIDYIEKRWNRVLAAAWLGKTRLIDNVVLTSLD